MLHGYCALPAIGAIFIAYGVYFLRRALRAQGEPKDQRVLLGCGGVLFMVLGSALALASLLASPTPGERKRLVDLVLRTPTDEIEQVTLSPAHYDSLITSPVVINDPQQLRRIAEILHRARGVAVQHPRTLWSVRVEVKTRRGTHGFVASHTDEPRHGTLVYVASNANGEGWSLGEFRADGLGRFIDDVATQAGVKR